MTKKSSCNDKDHYYFFLCCCYLLLLFTRHKGNKKKWNCVTKYKWQKNKMKHLVVVCQTKKKCIEKIWNVSWCFLMMILVVFWRIFCLFACENDENKYFVRFKWMSSWKIDRVRVFVMLYFKIRLNEIIVGEFKVMEFILLKFIKWWI